MEIETNKKNYIAPNAEVVSMSGGRNLLQGSNDLEIYKPEPFKYWL